MEFLVSIEKDKLRTYERVKGTFEPFFIEGGECFFFDGASIKQEVETYLSSLAREKNMESPDGIELIVLENSDELLNMKFSRAWGEHVKKVFQVGDMMGKVLNALQGNKELRVSEYGINYDGFSYVIRKGKIEKSDFDLLAYTIHAKNLIDLKLFEN